ncbi:bax Inhibitor-1 [Brevipalpus obovatus]|uniref:bax Inhibitor-1 n=1 Tax=Brevipalpus obovatus TaxID=246614 RepID=UPI003D9F3974
MTTLFQSLPNFFAALDRKLEKETRNHLKNVYGSMVVALAAATAGAYVHLYTSLLSGGLLSSLGTFGLIMALYSTPHTKENYTKRMGYLAGVGFCSGLSLGPLLEVAMFINPSLVLTALSCTAIIFASFSLSAIFADQGKWLYLGGLLSSALSMLFWMSLLNLFFGSRLIFQANLYMGLFVMSGFVMYDTTLIIEKHRRGDDDFISHAVMVFIDFISIFKHVLVILMQKEERQSRRRK